MLRNKILRPNDLRPQSSKKLSWTIWKWWSWVIPLRAKTNISSKRISDLLWNIFWHLMTQPKINRDLPVFENMKCFQNHQFFLAIVSAHFPAISCPIYIPISRHMNQTLTGFGSRVFGGPTVWELYSFKEYPLFISVVNHKDMYIYFSFLPKWEAQIIQVVFFLV